MSAKNVDGISADPQPRSGDRSLVNCVADRCVRRACAFGPHVALCGKTCEQVVASGKNCGNRALRNGLLDGLQVLRPRMQKEMNVGVDQPRQQRSISEFYDLNSRRMLHRRTNLGDPLSLHEHFAGRDDLPSLDVQQSRGMEYNCVRRRGRRWRLCPCRGKENATVIAQSQRRRKSVSSLHRYRILASYG